MVNLALKSQRLELCHPISVLRHRFCENGVFFSSTAGLVGLARECSAASLDVPLKRLGVYALALSSRRCAGRTFSIKWTVASRKWAPSDFVTTASTDLKAPSGNSR